MQQQKQHCHQKCNKQTCNIAADGSDKKHLLHIFLKGFYNHWKIGVYLSMHNLRLIYNHVHNICEFYKVLVEFPLTTS